MATYNNIKKIKIGDNIFNLYDSGNSGGTVTGVKINGTTKTPSSGIVDIGTVLTAHNTYTVSSSGSGNAVTGISLSGTTFTVTKGSTFLTSHQSLSDCVSKSTTTAQSIASDLNTKNLYLPKGDGIYFSQADEVKPHITGSSSSSYADNIYYYTGNNSTSPYHAFYSGGVGVFYIGSSSVYTSNSATFTSAGKLTVSSGGAAITGAVTTTSSLETGASITTGGSFVSAAHCRPNNNTSTTNNYLGTSDYRWNKIYAKTATIDTSDAKEKDILGPIDYAKKFIMNLNPIQYQWKESDHKRIHMGFIAQEVAEVGRTLEKNLSVYEANYKAPSDITDEDYDTDDYKYSGEEVDDNLLTWGLSYSELIAPMVQVIQDQQKEIESLKAQNIVIQKQLDILMN